MNKILIALAIALVFTVAGYLMGRASRPITYSNNGSVEFRR